MKFKSLVYSHASGKVGGLVYSHNSGGLYTRAYRVPVNNNTSFQQAVRNAVSQLQTRFSQTLTAAQRAAWAVFGQNVPWINDMGDTIRLSAQNWYLKCNVPRVQAGVAVIDPGPTLYELATLTPPVPTIVAAGTTASVAFTNADAWANEVGGYLLMYASRPQNGTVNFFAGPYRYVNKIAGAGTPPTSPNVPTLPFVIGPAASKMAFRFVAVRADGRPSASFRVVAAA